MYLKKEILHFGLIGFAAFCVDTLVLYAIKGHVGPYWGRAISFFVATIFTWVLNKNITFKGRASGKNLLAEFGHYLSLTLLGGSVNYLVYALGIACSAALAHHPVLAVALGSGAGALVNFLGIKYSLYKQAVP